MTDIEKPEPVKNDAVEQPQPVKHFVMDLEPLVVNAVPAFV